MSSLENAFLVGLSGTTCDQLKTDLTAVDLSLGERVFQQGAKVEWVYFPTSSLISLISLNAGGQTVETAMAGKEGAAGLLEACGSGRSSVEGVVQVDGRAWRTPVAHCRALAFGDTAFNVAAWKLAELQMAEARQSGLCHATHAVDARGARWILECSERSGGRNPMPMTQEFLASMLGVRRATVSDVANVLRERGAIVYSRGLLKIVDYVQLEKLSCDCRRISQEQRIRLDLSINSDLM